MKLQSPVPKRLVEAAKKRIPDIIVKYAESDDEFEQIYRLNHETYANELGQEPATQDGRLLDKLQDRCDYLIAKKEDKLVGLAAITRPGNVFSLESSLDDPSIVARVKKDACEFRRVAIVPEFRYQGLYVLLIESLAQYCIKNNISYVFTSAIVDNVKLYKKAGFFTFDKQFSKGRAIYQPMIGAMPGACDTILRSHIKNTKVLKDTTNAVGVLMDFDGTITRFDSLLGYFFYTMKRKSLRGLALILVSPALVIVWFIPNFRRMVVSVLFWMCTVGRSRKSIVNCLRQYGKYLISNCKFNEHIVQRLAQHIKAGHDIFVVSASPAIWIRLLLRSLGFENIRVIGSSMKFFCGGVVMKKRNVGAEKVRCLRTQANRQWHYAYSDSASDMPMLSLANNPYLVSANLSTFLRMQRKLKRLSLQNAKEEDRHQKGTG